MQEMKGKKRTLIACVDDAMGMMFNRRRLSQDKRVLEDIGQMCDGAKLWTAPYSEKLFKEYKVHIQISEEFLNLCGESDFCFLEDRKIGVYEERMSKIILYCWNRKYPSDIQLNLDWDKWKLERQTEFPGNSHEKITKQLYIRREDR